MTNRKNPFTERVAPSGRDMVRLLFSRRALLVAVLFWLPVSIFVALANEIREGDTLAFDRAVLEFIHNHLFTPVLTPYVVALTNIGGVIGTIIIFIGSVLLLLATGYRRSAAYVTAVIGGTALMNTFLKLVFARVRPSLFTTVIVEKSYSFPSGHSMMSCALALTAIVLAWRTRYRWLVTALATVYFLAISFTRLYLGVHYPTDVIGGWCISAAWVVAMYYALGMNQRATIKAGATPAEE